MLGALILATSKRAAKYVNIEAFIGVLYIFSVSAAILILDRSPHGLEEFKTIINGNIIWVTPAEILSTFIVYGLVGLLHFILWKKFYALSYEGKGGFWLEFLFLRKLRSRARKVGEDGRHSPGVLVPRDPGTDRTALYP